jgi:ribose 5-phosphate isomerase B
MKVILGADHGGFRIKEIIKDRLKSDDYEVVDVGSSSLVPEDDYVDYAKEAVREATSSNDRIILFCRNGFGVCIAANRYVGVRCGLAFSIEAVRKGRSDDDINALAIPSDYFQDLDVINMIEAFLKEPFVREEKYMRRIMKLDNLIS